MSQLNPISNNLHEFVCDIVFSEFKFDFDDSIFVHFYLLSKTVQSRLLSLQLAGILLDTIAGQLLDLQTVVLVLKCLEVLLEPPDLAGADLVLSVLSHATGRCLHALHLFF